MTVIHVPGYTLEIWPDDCVENPRNWDHLGTLLCWHRRYSLGDTNPYRTPADFAADITAKNALVLPVFLYDHSGLFFSTSNTRYPFTDIWDAGQVGYLFVTKEAIRTEYGVTRIIPAIREKVIAVLECELQTYQQYVNGEIFGFTLTDTTTGEVKDECGGFFGDDLSENGMLDYLPAGIHAAVQAAA